MAITTITNAMVSVNAIQGTLIADNAITAVHIATNAVSGTLIADNAVTAVHIAQNTITVTQLADDCVESDKIADGVITTNHLNKAMISSQTEVTAVAGDYVLLGDTSDSNNLKKALVSDFGVAGISSSADATAITIDSSEKVFVNGGVNITTTAGNTNLQVLTTNSQAADLGGSIGMGGVYNATNQITFAEIHGKKTNSTAANVHGYMAFVTRGDNIAERMRIDSGGRVGINQTPLTNYFALQVTGLGGGSGDARAVYLKGAGAHTSIGSTAPTLALQNTNSTTNNIVKLSFESASAGETVSINAINTNHSSHYGDMAFNTRGSDGYSEKMRILANGNVGIGETTPLASLHIKQGDSGLSSLNAAAHHLFLEDTGANGPGITFASGTSSNCTLAFGDSDSNYQGFLLYDNSADAMKFGVAGAGEKLRIQSGGGISFNGDAAADNALDDYEEGTWTPALGNVTTNSSTMYGIYTKIGNLVHIHAKIAATVASLPGATWKITGLPFTATNSSDTGQREIIVIGGDTYALGGYANGRTHFRTDGAELQGITMLSGSTAYWTYNTMDSTTFELHLSGTYRV